MPLNISNVGSSGIQVASEQIELQWLIINLLGLLAGIGAGFGVLGLKERLDFLHGLPWLGALLGGAGADGLRLRRKLVSDILCWNCVMRIVLPFLKRVFGEVWVGLEDVIDCDCDVSWLVDDLNDGYGDS